MKKVLFILLTIFLNTLNVHAEMSYEEVLNIKEVTVDDETYKCDYILERTYNQSEPHESSVYCINKQKHYYRLILLGHVIKPLRPYQGFVNEYPSYQKHKFVFYKLIKYEIIPLKYTTLKWIFGIEE